MDINRFLEILRTAYAGEALDILEDYQSGKLVLTGTVDNT
jgi:hypothetical protein